MSGVSILILTWNEEINIAECIDSCSWSDDIVVFDSVSQDSTREIALARGARVVERVFDNYARQRNAALTTVLYKNPWVLMVDADERVPSDLASEIVSAVAGASDKVAAFRMRRKDFFMGRWLRRSSGYPSWFARLLRLGRARIERDVNEETVADGSVEPLAGHLYHHPFNKGIAYWFERHNRYSNLEAIEKVKIQELNLSPWALLSRDPLARRRALKQWVYRLPLRPQIFFFYFYFVRLGVMDGRAGLYFSRMRAAYELMIDLKAVELRRRKRGLAV
jgi:glycosyltransferase involved in cell wall biosynthesis